MKEINKTNNVCYPHEITQRINNLVYRFSEGNRKTFAERINLPQQNFNRLFNIDKRTKKYPKPTEEIVEKVLLAFPEVNRVWLLTGEGDMIANMDDQKIETHLTPKDGINNPVPYFNVDFAGGWSSEEIFSTSRPDFYISNPEFDRCEFACNLVGHSISRRIPNRSIIGLKQVDDWQTYFPTNELYGIVMKNDLRTVKIVKRSKNKNSLLLVPDPLPEYNQTQYEPEEVPVEFVERFYQIVAWAQFERLAQ